MKMANNKKIIAIVLLAAAAIGAGLFFYISKPKQIVPSAADKSNNPGVAIFTDKTEYDKGEAINITIKNGSADPIFYFGYGDRLWGIEYLKDGEWVDHEWFQAAREGDVGGDCYVTFYERMEPVELAAGLDLSRQWDQKICPDSEESPDKPRTVKYIESGKYRLAFVYGPGVDSTDPYKILDYKTVYSDSFIIK
jgi:hypothetical protein